MGIFDFLKKKEDDSGFLLDVIETKDRRIKELEDLCEEKDEYFSEVISDGLRHGSTLAGKHMADKKEYKKSKK